MRIFPLLAIAILGLSACRDDLNDTSTPTPTPIPLVTPTPTPNPDGSTPDNTDSTGGSSSSSEGAAMTVVNEQVAVLSLDSTQVVQSILTIERANAEVWEFVLPGIPNSIIRSTVVYRNRALVFGSTSGVIIFDDGSVSNIDEATRIQ
jgi:hypothetical protein